MNISEWLDKKEAEGFDVSQIKLPDLAYEEDLRKQFISGRLSPAAPSVPVITPFPL